MQTADKNTFSTRWLITEAFMKLLAVRSFNKMTVSAIVRKAGISRSTFYLHFQDIIDLLDQMTSQIFNELVELYRIDWNDAFFASSFRESFDNQCPLPGTVKLIEHFRNYEHFYRDRFHDSSFVIRLSELLCTRLQLIYQDETIAVFLAYGTVGFIGRWLNEGLKGSSSEVALRLTNMALLSLPQVQREIKTSPDL